ncbi:signal recognition particle receptor subunit beta-like protein [Euroglyphus maynei]|uniref:Signal recognition particle receptor subunit beta n=1 Tax=Euroglyphus maynei TaxID=6958 RepID=A0A1Y3BP14_EURMA|nr:signal recognition particle receptor subunit beta-like protein [Euroglyphus maynei]
MLLDLPGFDRLRNQYWEKFKFRAKGIIFVIDSLNFMSNVHNVADLLYHYLCDSFVVSNRIPVLIACTKQDETRAKSAKVISSMLEKELETRIGALDTTSGDENSIQILGDPDSSFKFGDLKNSIDFADCTCVKEQKNLNNIFAWINSIA